MLLALYPPIGLVAFEAIFFSEDAYEHRRIQHFERLFNSHGGTILDPFLWFDFYYHGIIARRDLLHRIGGYLDGLEVGEDQDILFRAIEALPREQVRFIHEIGYEYRDNPAGVCCQRWEAVKPNYTATMLAATERRGENFRDCRFAGVKAVDGSRVDQYEYQSESGDWVSWDLV